MLRRPSLLGVLGWPLEHSLSPVIQQAAFRRLDLDWVYLPFPVPPERLADAITGLRALGAIGANVTMPHKEAVTSHLDGLSGDASSIGAVNTIQRLGDRLVGHNTDVDGFASFLADDAGLDAGGSRCLVMGAGGAARAVVCALNRLGAAHIAVSARRDAQAERVIALAPSAARLEWAEAAPRAGEFDLVVNATPLGMRGEALLGDASFREGQAVVDLVYDPPITPLVEQARRAGAAGWGGLGMLVHQAAASLRIWSGQEAPVEAMAMAAMHAVSRH